MKKLICLLFILSFVSIFFAVNKNVMYEKETKEIKGIVKNIVQTKDPNRIDIHCENDTHSYGSTDKLSIISVDEKVIPADITTKVYKVDTNTKEIYQEVLLEEIK